MFIICSISKEMDEKELEEFQSEMDFHIHLPALRERPLKERFELIRKFLNEEAKRLDRRIVVDVVFGFLFLFGAPIGTFLGNAILLMHNMIVAHAKVVIAYKEANYHGKIGIVHSLETKYPYNESKEDKQAAKNEDVLNNQILLDATFLGGYSEETMKVIQNLVELNHSTFEPNAEDKDILSGL